MKIPFVVALATLVASGGVGTAAADPMPIDLLVLMPGTKEQTDAFRERLRQIPYFANATDASSGSNVVLVASVAQVPTSGGTAASTTTGLLAASTLGIIPTVENKDVSVHYEVRTNYMTVAAFDYTRNFTSVSSLFGEFGKLPEDARQWLLQTVDTLGADVQKSAALTALQAEYDSYFARK